MNDKITKIGIINNTYGIKGQIKIKLDFDLNLFNFKNKFLFIFLNDIFNPYKVKLVIKNKKNYIISFENKNDINSVKELINCDIYCLNDDLLNFKELSNQKCDFLGFIVLDNKTKKIIGKIIDLNIETLNKFLIIKNKYSKKEILIPFCDEFIVNIDYTKKIVYINIIENLI